jgi:transcriptional regulator with XRE-family HTH domain
MSELQFKTAKELQVELGNRIQRLRLYRNIDQRSVAEKAGITRAAVQNLEAGRGSTVQTLVRVLKALNYLEGIEILAPETTVNPLALLRTAKAPQRARQLHSTRNQHL